MTTSNHLELGVNIDHVATLRQARYAAMPESPLAEPHPVLAALAAERAGAHGITAHLREDRRHIQDADIRQLRASISTKLNLEMGNSPGILEIALRELPEDVCLVPENRAEITTEGGLDAAGLFQQLAPTVRELAGAGIRVSLFLDPDPWQIDAASALGVPVIELHTGAFATACDDFDRKVKFERLQAAAEQAHALGIQVNAGHGINYDNIILIRTLPHLRELNIGHSIVSRAVSVGMEAAVREMLDLMRGERVKS